ncbi:MAG: hypothetical protein ACP5O4_08410, partial [bacterium]
MRRKIFSVLVAIAMVVSLIAPLGNVAKGAASLSIDYYPVYLPKDGTSGNANGTPIAFHFTLTGAAAGTYKYGAWIY